MVMGLVSHGRRRTGSTASEFAYPLSRPIKNRSLLRRLNVQSTPWNLPLATLNLRCRLPCSRRHLEAAVSV